MATADYDEETIPVPRRVRFPIELIPPEGFIPERLETWPKVNGRLEFVGGRLLFMPPCGDLQAQTVTDIVVVLGTRGRSHPQFIVGTNEAGMLLGGSVRGADAAIWRKTKDRAGGGVRRDAPVLAVEVSGRDEPEEQLREKAQWYLGLGVRVVWLVLPKSKEVVVLTRTTETRHVPGAPLPAHADLPDLAPDPAEFFVQISS